MNINGSIRFTILICVLLALVSFACTSGDTTDTSTQAAPQAVAPDSTQTLAPAATQTLAPDATQTFSPAQTMIPTSTPVPPSASFSFDVESGSAPLTVNFINTSTGQSTSVEWDFGDGTTSTNPSPSHDYTIAGTYDVKLTVSGSGGTDTRAMPGLITVQPGPPVGLLVLPDIAIVPIQETVQFSAFVLDEFGNALPISVTWVAAGDGGSISDDGRFTAGNLSDTFTDAVTASLLTGNGEFVATASVSVGAGPVAQVSVEPTEAVLRIGGSQPFTLMVLDEYGNQVHDFLSSWSVSPDVGTIDANGVLTSGTKAGLFLDTVKVDVVKGQDRVSATADVFIQSGPLATIVVEPSFTDVEMGAAQTFEATAFDQFGNIIAGLAFLWGATGGEITQSGLFTASEQGGSYEVSVSANDAGREAAVSAAVYIPSSIDRYSSLGSLAETAHAFAEPILAAVISATPDFQDDFTANNMGWGFNLGAGVDTPRGTMEIQDGVMRISDLIGQIIINGGSWTRSKDFVLELDARLAQGDFSTIQKFFFHQAGSYYFNIHLNSRGESWRYIKGTNFGGQILKQGSGGSPIGETTRYKLVVRGTEAVIYLNDDAILYLNDPDLDSSGLINFGCETSIEAICEFDNVKFWDLANIPDLP